MHGERELPPKGTVIGAGNSTVCDECPRARNVKMIKAFKRIQDIAPVDPTLCILEQGVPCNGPATRSGCNRTLSAGRRAVYRLLWSCGGRDGLWRASHHAFASVIDATAPVEIEKILDGIPDPAGQVYRFNLAGSLMKAAKPAWGKVRSTMHRARMEAL